MKTVAKLTMLSQAAMAKIMFEDKITDLSAWTMSKWKPDSETTAFELAAAQYGDAKDTALKTTKDAQFYGASAAFKESFSNKGKNLLVQYEATYDKDVECGGGYVKVGPKMEDATKFGDPTEYAMMFGPDKCGHTRRTHLIFNYKGKNVLKSADLPYKQDEEGLPTLYRVLVKPDNNVTVHINDEEVYSGNMETDWKLLEEKEIDDATDKKPEDWVDDPMMDDPADKKPEDWVEEKEIVDKSASQPEDWDAEEDGEWEPPMIPNPAYKGEWAAKRISNPAYKGVWAPKKIANPKYEADSDLYLMNKKDLGFIGLDLWQVKAGSLFDNFIIAVGDTEEDVKKEADEAVTAFKDKKDKMKAAKEKATATTTTSTTTADASEVDEDDDKKEEGKEDEDL